AHCGPVTHAGRQLWVMRVVLTVCRSLPVFHDKQTFSEPDGMSQMCQLLTFGLRYRQRVHPPHHSITSSARASNVGAMSRPSALAAFRLITSSYFVGACTGKSLTFVPRRMRSTYVAALRH